MPRWSAFASPSFREPAFAALGVGIKLHTLLDHAGNLPAFVAISEARSTKSKGPQSPPAQRLHCGEGMGYTDYDRYAQFTAQRIFFVTC
jgi:hypothetical protein